MKIDKSHSYPIQNLRFFFLLGVINTSKFLISPLPIHKVVGKPRPIIMSECENVQYVTESDNKLKQLVNNF